MKQATLKEKQKNEFIVHLKQRIIESCAILLLATSIFIAISLFTYNPKDPAWSFLGETNTIYNLAGKAGALIADISFYFFGYIAYVFVLAGLFSTYFLLNNKKTTVNFTYQQLGSRLFGLILVLISSCSLANYYFNSIFPKLVMGAGGILGQIIFKNMAVQLNVVGSLILLSAFFLIGITLFTGLSWMKFSYSTLRNGFNFLNLIFKNIYSSIIKMNTFVINKIAKLIEYKKNKSLEKSKFKIERKPNAVTNNLFIKKIKKEEPEKFKDNKIKVATNYQEKPIKKTIKDLASQLPSFELLQHSAAQKEEISPKVLQELSKLVEEKLADFGIEVEVVAVHPGPVITRFELNLAPGIKVSKITTLAKDLARSLSVVSVRVVEVIPGKPVVGLEVPNPDRQIVRLREVIDSQVYAKISSPLALALGKDIAGHPVVVDLAKMPHLLVAGTTGSGKSVGLNGMLLSILFKSQPEEVRLILIDPKMLELAVYDGIPHLLSPVVTDMKEAANSLRWCVAEMERRYQIMAALGVRNLSSYNKKIKDAINSGTPFKNPNFVPQDEDEVAEDLAPMPFIVVVVDEFADMIMVVGKKVEELIARIAQKARAAGIHLILATQRPSVDVITGLIKANVPTRIAFQVASRIDSRTILDQQGAEQLLGRGDMLYLPIGAGVPTRVHGAFVDDSEVHEVVKDLCSRGQPDYLEEILAGSHSKVTTINKAFLMNDDNNSEGEEDPLYDEAVKIVTETRRASISLVQRKLKIGYNRAARIIEEMEEQGIVSAMQSNGTREVLVSPPAEV